jgi:transposase
VDLRRERDIEQLRRVALAQQSQIEQLLRVLRSKCDELAALKGSEDELQQTLALIETLSKRVKTPPADDAKPTPSPADKPAPKAREHFGNTAQPKLPVIEQVFELDAADTTCPSCGGELAAMKGQFETSEMIDVIEVSYRVVKVKQQKYACKCGSCVETAPGPERAMPGGRYSLDFAIKIAIDKYLDHIPLARQERILRRHDLTVTSHDAVEPAQRARTKARVRVARPAGLPERSRAAITSRASRSVHRGRRNGERPGGIGGRISSTPRVPCPMSLLYTSLLEGLRSVNKRLQDPIAEMPE